MAASTEGPEQPEASPKKRKRTTAAAASPVAPSRRSGRERKQMNFFTTPADFSSGPAPTIIPEGKGTPLGEIENINTHLGASTLKTDDPLLKKLYSVCFNKMSKKVHCKKHLRLFCGWDSKAAEDAAKAKLAKCESAKILKPLCSLLDLHMGGTKVQLEERVFEFLQTPSSSGKSFTPLQKAGQKRKKATKKKSKKSKLSAYNVFQKEEGKVIRAEQPELDFKTVSGELAKRWSSMGEDDKQEWKDRADLVNAGQNEALPARKKQKVSKKTKKKKKRKSKVEVSSDEEATDESSEEEESSDDDLPLALKEEKSRLTAALRTLIFQGDLNTLTKGVIRAKLSEQFNEVSVFVHVPMYISII